MKNLNYVYAVIEGGILVEMYAPKILPPSNEIAFRVIDMDIEDEEIRKLAEKHLKQVQKWEEKDLYIQWYEA